MSDICKELRARAVNVSQNEDTLSAQLMESAALSLEQYRDDEVPKLFSDLDEARSHVAALRDAIQYSLGTAKCPWDKEALSRLEAAMLYTNDAARRHDNEVAARALDEARDRISELTGTGRSSEACVDMAVSLIAGVVGRWLDRLAAEKRRAK